MLSRLKAVIALLRNPKVSRFPKFLVIAAVLYLLMPFDFLPDAAPVVGWLDDIVFLLGALSLLFSSGSRAGAAQSTPDPARPSPPPSEQIIDITPERPKGR